MSIKVYLPIIIFLLLVSFYQLPVTNAQSNITDLTIVIPGEQQRTVSDKPVLVAGIWHQINATLTDNVDKLSIELYEGETSPVTKNETNYYKWDYNNGNWNEVTEYGGTTYSYIDTTNCKKTGNTHSFCIGINQYATTGNWTLEITANNIGIYNTTILVEQKIFEPGISNPKDFGLQAEPFTESNISSEHQDLYVSLENINGNIPLAINIYYSQYQNRVTLTNLENILHPFSKTKNYITVHTDNTWRAGIININATVNLTELYTIPTGTVALLGELQRTFTIPILIGHSNYTIYESPTTDIVFQYEEKLDTECNEIKDITAYISGNGNVSIKKITCENATLLKVKVNDETIGIGLSLPSDMPFLVHSTNLTEQQVVAQVHFTKENTTAFIHYEVEINGENLTFTTQINVGPKPPQEEKPPDTTLVMIIIGICIIAVIGYMIYSQMKYRRR